jgi:flavodoxin
LIAYFSRTGENYYHGGRRNLKIGNTEVLATMIRKHIVADVYRIRASNRYPHDYEATVARNVREQNADARPRIANPLKSMDSYDVVLLGSPIWNVRPPMIMSTFAESFDLSGKTIHPFVTYAVSGLGTTMETYRGLTDARISAGCCHARRNGQTGRRADARVAAPHQPPPLAHPRIENRTTAVTARSQRRRGGRAAAPPHRCGVLAERRDSPIRRPLLCRCRAAARRGRTGGRRGGPPAGRYRLWR